MLNLSQLLDSQHVLITLSLSVMLFSAFLLTRITKRLRLPNVTGYILAGVLIGPYVCGIIPQFIINGMEFVTDLALAIIAFGVGRYLKLSSLKKNGWKVVIITAMEALTTAIIVTLVMRLVFHLPWSFSLLLGAIGSATAPASTIMTIRQYRAKGRFVKVLLEIVALDDVVALLAFSVCAAVAQVFTTQEGALQAEVILLPILYNLLAIALGILLGFVLHKLVNGNRSQDHRLLLTVAMILLLAGLCSSVNVSPLLSCMALGSSCINFGKNKQVFKQLNRFSPPILALFFVLSGMRLDLNALATAGIIGVTYFFVRIIGKYLGSFLGALFTKSEKNIRNCLGLALIPQAGVSIGLALLAQRILPEEMGTLLSTIILSSSVLYEMIGPACAKGALFLSGAIKPGGPVDSITEEEALEITAEYAEKEERGKPIQKQEGPETSSHQLPIKR